MFTMQDAPLSKGICSTGLGDAWRESSDLRRDLSLLHESFGDALLPFVPAAPTMALFIWFQPRTVFQWQMWWWICWAGCHMFGTDSSFCLCTACWFHLNFSICWLCIGNRPWVFLSYYIVEWDCFMFGRGNQWCNAIDAHVVALH